MAQRHFTQFFASTDGTQAAEDQFTVAATPSTFWNRRWRVHYIALTDSTDNTQTRRTIVSIGDSSTPTTEVFALLFRTISGVTTLRLEGSFTEIVGPAVVFDSYEELRIEFNPTNWTGRVVRVIDEEEIVDFDFSEDFVDVSASAGRLRLGCSTVTSARGARGWVSLIYSMQSEAVAASSGDAGSVFTNDGYLTVLGL